MGLFRRRRPTLGDKILILPFRLVWWLLSLPFRLLLSLGEKDLENGYVVLGRENGRARFEHREVAKRILGRSLSASEVVHHINGKRSDNRPENLCVMSSYNHDRYHSWYDWVRANHRVFPKRETQLRKLKEDFGGVILSEVLKKTS